VKKILASGGNIFMKKKQPGICSAVCMAF